MFQRTVLGSFVKVLMEPRNDTILTNCYNRNFPHIINVRIMVSQKCLSFDHERAMKINYLYVKDHLSRNRYLEHAFRLMSSITYLLFV